MYGYSKLIAKQDALQYTVFFFYSCLNNNLLSISWLLKKYYNTILLPIGISSYNTYRLNRKLETYFLNKMITQEFKAVDSMVVSQQILTNFSTSTYFTCTNYGNLSREFYTPPQFPPINEPELKFQTRRETSPFSNVWKFDLLLVKKPPVNSLSKPQNKTAFSTKT